MTIGARWVSSPGVPCLVFIAVGSVPAMGLPSPPKAITRTISLLSSAIRIGLGGASSARSLAPPASSIIRGFATFGIGIGSVNAARFPLRSSATDLPASVSLDAFANAAIAWMRSSEQRLAVISPNRSAGASRRAGAILGR